MVKNDDLRKCVLFVNKVTIYSLRKVSQLTDPHHQDHRKLDLDVQQKTKNLGVITIFSPD